MVASGLEPGLFLLRHYLSPPGPDWLVRAMLVARTGCFLSINVRTSCRNGLGGQAMPDASSGNDLHRLIYFSTFSPTFPAALEQQDQEIANIVRVSVLNNGKLGL